MTEVLGLLLLAGVAALGCVQIVLLIREERASQYIDRIRRDALIHGKDGGA
jgi:hypothetical protein